MRNSKVIDQQTLDTFFGRRLLWYKVRVLCDKNIFTINLQKNKDFVIFLL